MEATGDDRPGSPDVYELNDDGFNATEVRVIASDLEAKAIRGMHACPERIISIEEE